LPSITLAGTSTWSTAGSSAVERISSSADHWGRIVGRAEACGRPIGAMDALLAATATQHQLTLVTRNITDFEVTGIRLFNPWPQGEDS
jgi:predicted nucleic acid-binding protein